MEFQKQNLFKNRNLKCLYCHFDQHNASLFIKVSFLELFPFIVQTFECSVITMFSQNIWWIYKNCHRDMYFEMVRYFYNITPNGCIIVPWKVTWRFVLFV